MIQRTLGPQKWVLQRERAKLVGGDLRACGARAATIVCGLVTAEEMIARLGLERLDREGGWFRRVYTGAAGAYGRPGCTTIYALFTREQFSALHRLDADEQFFFLGGDAFEVFEIGGDGIGNWIRMGGAVERGEALHRVFRKGTWFGGRPVAGGKLGWSLISAVVTPGFEWAGFEIGERGKLLAAYPDCADAVRELTRVSGLSTGSTGSGAK